jgi:hypothetical protein
VKFSSNTASFEEGIEAEKNQDHRERGAGIEPEKARRGMANVSMPLDHGRFNAKPGHAHKAEAHNKFKYPLSLAFGSSQPVTQVAHKKPAFLLGLPP